MSAQVTYMPDVDGLVIQLFAGEVMPEDVHGQPHEFPELALRLDVMCSADARIQLP